MVAAHHGDAFVIYIGMNYWIFVSARDPKNKSCPPAREIYERRMKEAFWGLGERTAYRKQIRQGDQIVYYLAGNSERVFVGTAQLASDYFKTSEEERSKHSHGSKCYEANYGVRLRYDSIKTWSSSRPISDLSPKLKVFLRGGIVPISEQDYSRITERSLVTP